MGEISGTITAVKNLYLMDEIRDVFAVPYKSFQEEEGKQQCYPRLRNLCIWVPSHLNTFQDSHEAI